jgi:hypothetical protein
LGTTSVKLSFPPDGYIGSPPYPLITRWTLWDFSVPGLAWDLLWRDVEGVFENKEWGVMWLWVLDDHSSWQNVFILHDPPRGRFDTSHRSGRGRVFTAKNPAYSDTLLRWTVTASW